jgi:cytochrome c553
MSLARRLRTVGRPRCLPALLVALAAAPVAATPVEDTLAQRLRACTACHGATDVVTADAYFPRLAGKPAGYLVEQLHNFREGRRRYAPMEHLLAGLPEPFLAEIAGHFAAQLPRQDAPAPKPVERPPGELPRPTPQGEQVVREGLPAAQVPACVQCHGVALTGIAPAVPGLVGLPKNYLAAQLGAWRTGQRQARAPDCMAQIARRLPADDLAAAVAWLAAQPLPADARPSSVAPPRWPLDCGSVRPASVAP